VSYLRERKDYYEYPVVPDEAWVSIGEVEVLKDPQRSRRSTKITFE
jgi:hypothetical protein